MGKVQTNFGATHAAVQMMSFFRDVPAYSSKTIPSHILHVLQQCDLIGKEQLD